MTGRIKLRWTEFPQHSLRSGLACHAGGARVVLLTGDDRKVAEPSPEMNAGAGPDCERQPTGQPR